MTDRVSVIIPTWNRADTIEKAVASALAQSFPVLEVLVCDDGSTDGTLGCIRELATQDHRVRWISAAHAGRPAVPRNRGILASRGDWLAFLDSDDAWLPGKIAAQLDAAHRLGCLAACSNAMRVLRDGTELGAVLDWSGSRVTLDDLIAVNQVICSSSIARRSVVVEAGGFPEAPEFKAIEDYALWLRVAQRTDFAYCPELFVRYRDEPGSSIRATQDLSPYRQKQLVLGSLKQWVQAQSDDTLARRRLLRKIFQSRLVLSMKSTACWGRHGLSRLLTERRH